MPFESLDGTNAALKRLVEEGSDVGEGVTVWAKMQTAGRGRAGRTWASPPGNVYVSILVAVPDVKADAPQLGFVAALAVVDAIFELPRHNAPPPAVMCKWPNDVLVDGAKVCGILPELVTGPDQRSWIVLGIGVNLIAVDVGPGAFPATALSLHGIDTSPAHVLTVLSRTLATWVARWRAEGFAVIREAWMTRGPAPGTTVTVGLPGGAVAGGFAGLDADGGLLLETGTGRRKIVAGDVLFGGGEG